MDALEELRTRGHRPEVLFLEAADETLVRRYHETRRRHPLAGEGNVVDGIQAERRFLAHLREEADRIIDTTGLTVHQLKDRLIESYGGRETRGALTVSLVSFGFKHGIPYDADLVFDVRFLNPTSWRTSVRDGRDLVAQFVLSTTRRDLLGRLEDLCASSAALPARGKAYLTVAMAAGGATGLAWSSHFVFMG
jgi:UPF0042 nucleotide-binding protein